MEAELAKSIAMDDHLAKTPEEDKYGRYELSHDYVANGQIMVTITLAEYRELLTRHASDQVSEANSKRFTVERERDELKKQAENLRKQLNELRVMIASAMPVKAPEPGDE
jgi:hypothetical protein